MLHYSASGPHAEPHPSRIWSHSPSVLLHGKAMVHRAVLPPLNPTRAFEATGRLLSISKAADELAVTPAAVSRQVRTLEAYLGFGSVRASERTAGADAGGRPASGGTDAAVRIAARSHRQVWTETVQAAFRRHAFEGIAQDEAAFCGAACRSFYFRGWLRAGTPSRFSSLYAGSAPATPRGRSRYNN